MADNSTLWRHSCSETVSAAPLDEDQDVDLAVIGGGFTGCAAALHAAEQGARTCLLEAERIGHGGSGRNVGLVNAGLWMPPDDILATLGVEAGQKLIEVLGGAPGEVFDLIDQHGIDCAPKRAGTLHLAHGPSGLADLQNRFRQGNRFGAPLQLLDAQETARRTGTDIYHGALWDPRAGTIQPLAYCTGLARVAQAKGARLFAPAPVQRLWREANVWVIACGAYRVKAKAVLVATNAYHRVFDGAPPPAFTAVHYSQFATDPLTEDQRKRILPGGEGCWDTAQVMSSFRLDARGRMILGGMGHQSGFAAPIHRAWARRKLRAVFPEIADMPFQHAWSGRIAMTADHLPKLIHFGPNALMIYGYSGRGIAPGTVLGGLAAQALIQGQEDQLPLPLTASHRESLTATRGLFFEMGAAAMHLISARGRNRHS